MTSLVNVVLGAVQGFSVDGTRTAGGARSVVRWYAYLFRNFNTFYREILKMLVALLKLFECTEMERKTFAYLLTYLLTCLLTYLLTYSLHAAVFLEKLVGFHLVKKFPRIL